MSATAYKGQDQTISYKDHSFLGGPATPVVSVSGTNGNLTLGGPAAITSAVLRGETALPQSLSGAGAISTTTYITQFTSSAAGNALTLANGSMVGQLKLVTHWVKGTSGTGVITPASAGNFATATLTNAHDWVLFKWNGASWDVLQGSATYT